MFASCKAEEGSIFQSCTSPGKGKNKRILALFDVDGTLTVPRKVVSPETTAFMADLRKKITIGVVGGSDLVKQREQLGANVTDLFDYSFSENGLMAFKDGKKIGETSLVGHLGEENLQRLVNFILGYFSKIQLPQKRGTFIEFRQGMLNVSPIGRNCSREERNEFEKYDKIHNIRTTMVEALKKEFLDLNMTYSIGGQISFDVFPKGWDKTYCLKYLPEEEYDEIHFFGDKYWEGGNDYEIYSSDRTIGHAIEDANPQTTINTLSELFGIPAVTVSAAADHGAEPEDASPAPVPVAAAGKNKRILALFDVDGTLTVPRKVVSPETTAFMADLRKKITIGVVGGSDLVKQREQLGANVTDLFDYSFSENGLMAFKDGKKIGETSLVGHLGEENLQRLVNFILGYFSKIQLPQKRGTFIEFRQGMLNVSPIGRNCSREERNEFEKYDKIHNIRTTMVEALKKEFLDLNMTYSIGGQISFDVFPKGWDKTYCLKYLPEEEYDEIHFFGDKYWEGGNDYEIYSSDRTIGHAIEDANPQTTINTLSELFGIPAVTVSAAKDH